MSEPQASPATALLARKGLAAPIGAASDAALAPAPESETLPEVGTLAQAAAAPAASLRPLDFLTERPPERPPGRPGARDLARKPPDPPEAPAEPEVKLAPSGDAVPELSAKPEVPRPAPVPLREPRRFPALAAGLALAFVLAAAGYGYQSGWFASPSPERSQAPAPAPAALAPAQMQPEAPPAAPSVTESEPSPGASPGAEQPSVDVVRIEPDGAAVIAGRAAPGVELILLDNGAPIGTVTADAYGEWVFIPASPLPSGAHDFGLVIKEVRGGISVPAAGQAPTEQESGAPGVSGTNEPGTVAGAAAAVPIPPRKPDVGTTQAVAERAAGVPSPAFVVQLASVKDRTGAQREWRALRKRFPEILSAMSLSLDEAKLAGGVSVVRLRIGAFPKQADADALCALLAAKHQDCLVVRTAVKR